MFTRRRHRSFLALILALTLTLTLTLRLTHAEPSSPQAAPSASTETVTVSTHPPLLNEKQLLEAQKLAASGQTYQQDRHHGTHIRHGHRFPRHDPNHPGHITAGTVLLTLIGAMVLVQGTVVVWRRRHPASFKLVTIALLWLLPFAMSLDGHFWRFILVWASFSVATIYHIYLATRKPLDRDVPRRVYGWMSKAYYFSVSCGLIGYGMMLTSFFGHISIMGIDVARTGLLCLFYGMYFGVLVRDCAELCSERMSASMGYYHKDGLPSRELRANWCAVCDNALLATVRADQDKSGNENVITLSCDHQFHELCIRGWAIVGKKDVCPYCAEKVQLKWKLTNPWEAHKHTWTRLLELVRYLVVWNPIIFLITRVVLHFVGDEPGL
jgi:RING finger protein 121/175